METDTSPFVSEDATPGSGVCVRVLSFLGRFKRAGLRGALWCASAFLSPFLCSLCLLGSLQAGAALFLFRSVFLFVFSLFCAPGVSGLLCFPALGPVGPGVAWVTLPPHLLFFSAPSVALVF